MLGLAQRLEVFSLAELPFFTVDVACAGKSFLQHGNHTQKHLRALVGVEVRKLPQVHVGLLLKNELRKLRNLLVVMAPLFRGQGVALRHQTLLLAAVEAVAAFDRDVAEHDSDVLLADFAVLVEVENVEAELQFLVECGRIDCCHHFREIGLADPALLVLVVRATECIESV